MVHRSSVPVLLIASILLLGCAADAAAQQIPNLPPATTGITTLTTSLTGGAEVPGPGASGGTGSALVVLNPNRNRVCYALKISGIKVPGAAHIHEGAAGASGPPVVNFDLPSNGFGACISTDRSTIDRIRQNPSSFYVNVHNEDYPAGAVRGQLGN